MRGRRYLRESRPVRAVQCARRRPRSRCARRSPRCRRGRSGTRSSRAGGPRLTTRDLVARRARKADAPEEHEQRPLPVDGNESRVAARFDDAQRDRVDDCVDVHRAGREHDTIHRRSARVAECVVDRVDTVAVDGAVEQARWRGSRRRRRAGPGTRAHPSTLRRSRGPYRQPRTGRKSSSMDLTGRAPSAEPGSAGEVERPDGRVLPDDRDRHPLVPRAAQRHVDIDA